jgi:hypothetical protein
LFGQAFPANSLVTLSACPSQDEIGSSDVTLGLLTMSANRRLLCCGLKRSSRLPSGSKTKKSCAIIVGQRDSGAMRRRAGRKLDICNGNFAGAEPKTATSGRQWPGRTVSLVGYDGG